MTTKRERREQLISLLWSKFTDNPFYLIAISKLQEDRDRYRGWIYEDELPPDYDYDANYHRSQVIDGVRMFPEQPTRG